ncbi:uncharacterized protein LOC135098647 isoform X2 [Scylla paramamosain]|uniref:uncharacterized protein LOC135098647 isoform X2 n=1 Tax=Scylla paramamosain TaxID=85552 RepID=UPI003082F1BB
MMGVKAGLRPAAPPPGLPEGPRPPHLARSFSSYSSSPERLELLYSSQERMHGDGYLSSPERSPRPYGGGGLPSSPPPLVTRILTMGASTHHAAAPSPPSLTRRPGQRSTV